ncbi:MAG: transcription antitermination factor NusB [Candidatus Melainabacteria bacterium GWF2_37_15]|nr:MAG: transcription antitermination factor NusB [Candidatus Melainabacteria bacterium GWF2_37_15]
MNKRRASRELALMAYSHLSKSLKKSEDVDIADIIHKSAETLSYEAESNLDSAVKELLKIREFVYNYEMDHPVNLERPFETSTLPVGIPLTSDMLGRIDMVIEAADKTYSAIDLIRLASFEELNEVKDYAVKLVKTFLDNKEEVDQKIKEHSKDWDVERLVKIDRDILRIAVTEILYFEDVPNGVSIDEAVELAKKYSTDESSKFINGVLGQVVNV